jgi:hypothetical protein
MSCRTDYGACQINLSDTVVGSDNITSQIDIATSLATHYNFALISATHDPLF